MHAYGNKLNTPEQLMVQTKHPLPRSYHLFSIWPQPFQAADSQPGHPITWGFGKISELQPPTEGMTAESLGWDPGIFLLQSSQCNCDMEPRLKPCFNLRPNSNLGNQLKTWCFDFQILVYISILIQYYEWWEFKLWMLPSDTRCSSQYLKFLV